ncbi:phosphatase PAP2 family protein [Gryllotalpicola reticulitermitis]|uniref:Phosphatase PAP2 family protein n=1 Tax=Gryllotalpicola reticulitermitis TaxID=1184153 RepID=A0ABV8Q4A5_9MICO
MTGSPSYARTTVSGLRQRRHPWITLMVGTGAALVILLWGLASRGSRAGFDVDLWLDAHHRPGVTLLALGLSKLFSPAPAVAMGFVFAVVVAILTKRAATGLAAGLVTGLSWASSDIVKLLVHRPRPDWGLLPHHVGVAEIDPSFPSGHVTFAAALTVTAVMLLRRFEWRVFTAVVGLCVTVTVAFARLYVGAHYPSDVLAAALYGFLVTPSAFVVIAWLDQTTPVGRVIDAAAAAVFPRIFERHDRLELVA